MHLVTRDRPALDAESDEDLLIAVHAGDPAEREAASAEFFRRYVRKVHGYVRREYLHTLGPHGVEDLVMHAFAKAFERAGSYRAAADPAASRKRTFSWLARIADNLFTDWLRSTNEATPLPLQEIGKDSTYGRVHGTAVSLDDLDLDADEADDEAGAPDPLMFTEEGRRLRACLEELSERDREVVLLYEKYRVPDRPLRIDAGERTSLLARWGMKPTSLGNVQRRARQKLEQCCERHGDS